MIALAGFQGASFEFEFDSLAIDSSIASTVLYLLKLVFFKFEKTSYSITPPQTDLGVSGVVLCFQVSLWELQHSPLMLSPARL